MGIDDMNEWTMHELKPIHMLLNQYAFEIRSFGEIDGGGDGYDFPRQGWTINGTMLKKFGDKELYNFQRVEDGQGYSHKCNDGYYYSEKWFVESLPIIQLDDKDFLL